MEHLGTKILETERLLLRPFVVEDAEAMYRNWASDPDVTKYLTWPAHVSPEATAELLAGWVKQYERKDYYTWAIVLQELGQPVGSISVVSHNDRACKATVGYCTGKQWWRQGINSEALRRVIDYLIGEVGMNRVDACHDTNNPNSGLVMRKCGMTYEGTWRQGSWNNQGICDACYYSILAEEWKNGGNNNGRGEQF